MLALDTADLFFRWQLLPKLYLSLYVSQFFVCYPLSKKRGFYKLDKRNRFRYKRMIKTYSTTVILPVAFAIAISPLILKLSSRPSTFSSYLLVLYLLFAWPFPYYCNQSWLSQARKDEWCTIEECPEVHKGETWFWRLCLALTCFFLVVLCFLVLFRKIT